MAIVRLLVERLGFPNIAVDVAPEEAERLISVWESPNLVWEEQFHPTGIVILRRPVPLDPVITMTTVEGHVKSLRRSTIVALSTTIPERRYGQK